MKNSFLFHIQIAGLLFSLYHFLNGDFLIALELLIEALFLEKFIVFLLHLTSNFMLGSRQELRKSDYQFLEIINDAVITKRNDLGLTRRINIAKWCDDYSNALEENYTHITNIPENLQKITPAPIKILLKEFAGIFTPVEYFIRQLLNNQINRNTNINLGIISVEEANAVVNALENENCSSIKSLNFSTNHLWILFNGHRIPRLVRRRNIKNAAIECITFQQGKRSAQSFVSQLPQEMLDIIYENIFPYPEKEKKQKNFIKNVSCYQHNFFKSTNKKLIDSSEHNQALRLNAK